MKKSLMAAALAAMFGFAGGASATGIPTVDIAALAQSILDYSSQLQQLDEAVQTVDNGLEQIDQARRTVAEAQRSFDSLNGIRGLGSLLNSDLYRQSRNYLPGDWQKTLDLGGDISNARFSSLRDIRETTREAGRLYPDRSALNAPTGSQALTLLDKQEDISTDALTAAAVSKQVGDARTDELNQYKDAINTLPDQKSTLDLQASMMAEGLQMQNELIQVINRKNELDAQVLQQQTQDRERAIYLANLPYDPRAANEAARAATEAR